MDNNKYEFIRKLESLLKLGDSNIKSVILWDDDIVEVVLRSGFKQEIDVYGCTATQAVHKITGGIIDK